MKEYTVDTASEYDDLVGYISEENLPNNGLAELLEIQEDYKPNVKPKSVDPEFPEPWQDIYVNFNSLEEYAKFMTEIGEVAHPKLKEFVYNPHDNETSIFNFL
jgi:hypothetical protein